MPGISDRVHLSGPAIHFDEQVGLGMTLALHELTKNAIKYGALSNEGGRIDLHWALETAD